MVDCRCLVAIAMIHVICLQLLYATESVEVQPVQLLPDDFAGMWPSAYSRELRNGKYMRFGRASTIPRYLLDDKNMQLEGIDRETLEFLELVATERSIPERTRRLLIKFALRRLARRANDAKVLTASSEGEKEES